MSTFPKPQFRTKNNGGTTIIVVFIIALMLFILGVITISPRPYVPDYLNSGRP